MSPIRNTVALAPYRAAADIKGALKKGLKGEISIEFVVLASLMALGLSLVLPALVTALGDHITDITNYLTGLNPVPTA